MWSLVYMCKHKQSRVPPATGVPVVIVDAVHVTGPSTTFMRPQQTWIAQFISVCSCLKLA
jgi:hypothetical protein